MIHLLDVPVVGKSAGIDGLQPGWTRAHFLLLVEVTTMLTPKPRSQVMFALGLRRFIADRRGANMVEYILLVGVVALIAIAGFKLFGGKVREKIDEQGTSVGGINGQAQ